MIGGTLDVEAIWNSERAQDFRRSMLDGSFEFCDHTICPIIQNGSLPDRKAVDTGAFGPAAQAILDGKTLTSAGPTFINLACDRSCNLQCPSCRAGFYFLNERVDSEQFQRKRALLEVQDKIRDGLTIQKINEKMTQLRGKAQIQLYKDRIKNEPAASAPPTAAPSK